MCGIAGFVETAGGRGAAELTALAAAMADRLTHRGPDDAGTWVDPSAGVALAHRRLSVVDLSAAGHQPMASASGRYQLVLNGEIYNFPELREELEGAGARFRGRSDTEVLLAAIEAWGLQQALRRSVGMFAFALWDVTERVLHLARDRMGEKPLVLGWQRDVLLFGSEVKALRAHPAFAAGIDRDGVALYLRLGYLPAPWSILAGLRHLPPGCVLSLPHRLLVEGEAACAAIRPEPYWSAWGAVRAGLRQPFRGSVAEAEEALHERLARAVRRQMVADVPLGAFLSGGVDSSTIVALMAAQSSRRVRTFTIGFHEAERDETAHARSVARHLGTDHEELVLTPAETLAVIPRLPELFDEPFADPSQVPTFLVARMARRHVTVALSGDGGDELFGGYDRHGWTRRLERVVGLVPGPARRGLARAALAVPQDTWSALLGALGPLRPRRARRPHAGELVHRLARLARVPTPDDVYLGVVSLWPEPERLVPGAREPAWAVAGGVEPLPWRDPLERLLALDAVTYLPDDILVKVDRAAMGVSLETRVPLLDHEVVELAASLPPSMKRRGGSGKWLLRRVLARHVPPALTDRPKAGFGVPMAAWLRGPLREWAEALLVPARLEAGALLDPAPVRAAWADLLSGRRAQAHGLWAVLMLQAWRERWGE